MKQLIPLLAAFTDPEILHIGGSSRFHIPAIGSNLRIAAGLLFHFFDNTQRPSGSSNEVSDQ